MPFNPQEIIKEFAIGPYTVPRTRYKVVFVHSSEDDVTAQKIARRIEEADAIVEMVDGDEAWKDGTLRFLKFVFHSDELCFYLTRYSTKRRWLSYYIASVRRMAIISFIIDAGESPSSLIAAGSDLLAYVTKEYTFYRADQWDQYMASLQERMANWSYEDPLERVSRLLTDDLKTGSESQPTPRGAQDREPELGNTGSPRSED